MPGAGQLRRIGTFRCQVRASLTGQQRAIELFVPWGGAEAADWTLESTVDSALLTELRRYAEEQTASDRLEIFAGETFLRRYPYGEGTLLIDESSTEHAYLRHGATVTVVLGEDRPSLGSYGVRAFRELFHRTQEEAGGLMLHAAACATAEGAAVIVGGKGAGKTTLMLAGCLAGGAGYVANDRVMAAPRDGGWEALAFPMVCRVHPGTAGLFDRLTALALNASPLARRQHELFRRRHDDIETVRRAAGPDVKLELAPAEITELLGVPTIDAAPVRCVLLPQVDPDFDGVEVTPESPERAAAVLVEQCLTPQEEKWITPWLVPRTRTAEELRRYAHDRIAELTRALPCLRVRYGHGADAAHQAGKHVTELISSARSAA